MKLSKTAALALLIGIFSLVAALGLAQVQVGDTVLFGSYEQDNDLANGPEPIEWQVLAIEDGNAMMISRWILDKAAYSDGRATTSWVRSSLRAWLNDGFYNTAFTDEEKQKLVAKELSTRYEKHGKTADPVTLIGTDDALHLMQGMETRKAYPTEYAKAQGIYKSEKYHPSTHYWTRNPSFAAWYKASFIAASGGVMKCGGSASAPNYGVRPVIYVPAEALSAN